MVTIAFFSKKTYYFDNQIKLFSHFRNFNPTPGLIIMDNKKLINDDGRGMEEIFKKVTSYYDPLHSFRRRILY